jgi:hypothetical protein
VRTALLACVYYLVITPVGLLSRLRDPLRRRHDPRRQTYLDTPAR